MSNTTSDGTSVHNQNLYSTTGRLGIAVGRNTGRASFYAKASMVREFSANAEVTMSTGNLSPITLEQNIKENWLEFAIGMTSVIDKKTSVYLELDKTTGDKTKTPWLFNVGIRKSF